MNGTGPPGGSFPARLTRRLDRVPRRRIPEGEAERRAAVVLLLRSAGGEPDAAGGNADDPGEPQALFVRRARREGDPWSGQVGLPGGHREPGDLDLAAAALRELREETGLALSASALLGRLPDVHPRSRRLPSVAVSPFVGWLDEPDAELRPGSEVEGHLWVPLAVLRDPAHRSVLVFRRGEALRVFPSVEFEGYTIWGLTFAIVRHFLALGP